MHTSESPANGIERSDNKAQLTTAAAVCSTSGTDSPTVNVYSAEVKKLLQVVPVRISNETTGKGKNALAFLDSGVDTHLFTKRLYLDLGLNGRRIRSSLQLADGNVMVTHTVEVECIVRSVFNHFNPVGTYCICPKILHHSTKAFFFH